MLFAKRVWSMRAKNRFFILFLVIAIVASACASGEKMAFPERIAGLKLTENVSGNEAIKVIAKLHGKKIRMKNGHIAHYHVGPHMVMVYVSESYLDFFAGRLLNSMTANIRKGNDIFKDLKELRIGDIPVYSVTGQGQLHFFFKYANKVVWVGADPPLARRAAEEIIAFLKMSTSGRKA